MIIQNAAFIFDTLTKKLSRPKVSKQLSVLKGRIAKAGSVLAQSWTVTLEKIIRIVFSRSFLKKNPAFFMLIKEQNKSYQNSLLIGSNGLLNSFKLMYQFGLLERLRSF